MGRPSTARVEAGFEFVAALRHIERRWPEYRDPGFWSRLNPQLSVTEGPLPALGRAPLAINDATVERAARQLDRSGYLATPPVVPESRMAPIRQAMDVLAAHHIPTGFACVYDQYYELFAGLQPIFEPILGAGYLWVAHGFWAFRVPVDDQAVNGLTAPSAPHRDSMGPDPRIIAGLRPGIMTVWIALTDVTPSDSCLYVVPRPADRAFATADRDVRPDQFELQDVRAVPVPAGAVVAWSTHLIHWGSRSSPEATGPRMSATMYLQRADVPPFDASAFGAGDAVTLDDRLRWVLQSLGAHDLLSRLDWGPRRA